MSVSILEALQNADYNLSNNGSIGVLFAMGQIHNSVVLLEKGYGINEQIEPLLDKYETVECVPQKQLKQNNEN